MDMQTSFTVKTKELKTALNDIESLSFKLSKTTMLKISVLSDTIQIAKQGMMKIIKAKTDGLADILVPGLIFKGYVSTASAAEITFVFKNGELQCGSAFFSSPAISVETVFNIPENELPINASRISVLRFASNKTDKEIEKLGLTASIKYTKRLQREKIQQAVELLKDYEVTFEELKDLIDNKIKEP